MVEFLKSMLAEQLAGLRVYTDPLYFCGSIAPVFDVVQPTGMLMNIDLAALFIRCMAIFEGHPISALLLLVCNGSLY